MYRSWDQLLNWAASINPAFSTSKQDHTARVTRDSPRASICRLKSDLVRDLPLGFVRNFGQALSMDPYFSVTICSNKTMTHAGSWVVLDITFSSRSLSNSVSFPFSSSLSRCSSCCLRSADSRDILWSSSVCCSCATYSAVRWWSSSEISWICRSFSAFSLCWLSYCSTSAFILSPAAPIFLISSSSSLCAAAMQASFFRRSTTTRQAKKHRWFWATESTGL
mmetsp:Transcript_108089/g.247879  ORF Transcript_108089/g.247879 Transcript_108089/m.247879 type:complete len:222 (-) Transcript_108089:34-699(-)